MKTHPLATLSDSVAYLDLETTGLDPRRNKIIEIGIVHSSQGKLKKYHWFVDPGEDIPPEIIRFTGITEADIAGAPHFSTLAEELLELLTDSVVVAHNARFDVGFLTESFAREGFSFRPKQLCSVALSRALIPNLTRANLDSVLRSLNIPSHDRHRALPDAEAVFDVVATLSTHPDFDQTVNRLVHGRISCPPGLTQKQFDDLPQSPGVYLFLNKEKTVLYVGKANNIRARVRSHFSGVLTGSDALIWKEITAVSFETTNGEIEALLRESQLVKTLSPLHNKQLRRNSSMHAVVYQNEHFKIKTVHELATGEIDSVVGVFRSVTQAKERLWELANEFHLCPKHLGLSFEKSGCFYSQIGKCYGVCSGDETLPDYLARVEGAIKSIRVPAWPYPNQVVLLTEKKTTVEKISHVIFNWCYMGVVKGETAEVTPLHFDWDMYKILRKAIVYPKKWRVLLTAVPMDKFKAAM